uniref:Neurexin-1a n=1 Tax=Panagrellus redivivus TaxID=6233 RepID=A0A7E4WBE8_PANRE
MIPRKKPLPLTLFLLITTISITPTLSVILSGSTEAFARFPKWAQTFENQLSLEFRTRSHAALLFYTDDGGVQGNFYALTIVEGRLQLDFRLGDSNQDVLSERPVHSIRVEQLRVDDGKWHKFILFQAWENVKVQLDDTVVFKILTQRSFVFGNLRTNSDVFIGGVPNDVHQLGEMSSPLRRHTKRFAGTVKNLVYRLYPQGVSSPQMISSNGTRLTDDDYCALESPCKNGGSCYSTNDGAACNCAFTDFGGSICTKPRPGQALSFFGNEWIGYDVTNHTAALVQNRFENVSIMFRTAHSTGLLFTAGDKTSYVQLILERGILIAASKLFGTEKRIIRMFNKNAQPARFDDDQWHEVNLYRDVQLMRLTVDGQSDEVKQFSGDAEWLGNSFAYVGGTLPHRPYIPAYAQPFRGCMKRIRYEADAQLLDVIELADQGFGQSVIRTGGDLSFACERGRLAPAPDVLSFNSAASTVALPKWNSPSGGSLGFQFRTGESDALVLYHGQKKQHNATHGDYIAFELIDGHLFLVLNLGSGAVRLQATAVRVDDPRVWHSVTLERLGRGGTVVVDHLRTDFSTPGVSANLDIEDPVFIGGMPFSTYETAPTVWSAHLKKGFIGCLRNVRINGINAQISKLFVEQSVNSTAKGEIVIGCPALSGSDFCAAEPCLNGATCRNGHTSFHCDCARTHFEGPRCNTEPLVFSFARRHGDAPRIRLPRMKQSQAEEIEMKFRTEDTRAILLDGSGREAGGDRLRLSLDRGRLQLRISMNGSRQAFGWGENLNDNQWHTARIHRRGSSLRLFVDGKWEQQYNLPEHQINLVIDEIAVAEPMQTYEGDSEEFTENDDFDGDLIRATFNDLDLLEEPKNRLLDRTASSSEEKPSGQRLKHRKVKSATVWFDSAEGHLSFPIFKNTTQSGLRFGIKFRTLAADATIALLWNQKTIGPELISIQLYRGLLRITRISGSQLLTGTIRGRRYNDLKWHSVHLFELDAYGGLRLAVENRTAEIRSDTMTPFRVPGRLFIGGLPTDVAWPSGVMPTVGFRGCMATLKIGNDPIDLWSDAESAVLVEKGCRAPPNRCHPETCKNHGICQQSWTNVHCDCSLTPYSGKHCESLGTTYDFDGDGASVYYEYPPLQRPSTAEDSLVFAFMTDHSNGVLVSVQCGVEGDFLAVYLAGGHLQARFSLGSGVHHMRLTEDVLNDGKWHVVRLKRRAANLTLGLDDALPVKYAPKDGLATLNTQWRVAVGAAFNALHSKVRRRRRPRNNTASASSPTSTARVFDEFRGRIAGVNFNGLHILDAFAHGSEHALATGHPRLVHMAPNETPVDVSLFSRVVEEVTGDDFFAASPLDCVSLDHGADCFAATAPGDDANPGFITPAFVPSSTIRPPSDPLTTVRTTIATVIKDVQTTVFDTWVDSTTTMPPAMEPLKPKPTISRIVTKVMPVRPTTPMGDFLTSAPPTVRSYNTAAHDFPRTQLILIASISVIVVIAIIVFLIFCCMQQHNSDVKPPPAAIAGGYAPIPSESSPREPRVCPIVSTNNNGTTTTGIANGNGATMTMANGNGNLSMKRRGVNGLGAPLLNGDRKKDFKEWYV